jgi:hypothetical protein
VISSAPHYAKTLPQPIRVSCFPSFGLARQHSDFEIVLFQRPPPPPPPSNAAPFRLVSVAMKVTYTSYTAVAEWKWDLPEEADDTCGICRVQFEGTCAKCKYPGQDCPIGIALSTLQPFITRVLTVNNSHRSMHTLLPHALHQRLDLLRGQSRQMSHVSPAVQGEGRRCWW